MFAPLSPLEALQNPGWRIRFGHHRPGGGSPSAHSAADIHRVPALLQQIGGDVGGAASGAAHNVHRAIRERGGELLEPLRHLSHGDVHRYRRVTSGPLVVLPDIK